MKDYEPRQAGRVLADLSARHPHLSDGLTARRLEEVWMRLLGERARRYTVQVHFSRGVMTVEVSNDAGKTHFFLSAPGISQRETPRLAGKSWRNCGFYEPPEALKISKLWIKFRPGTGEDGY